MILRMAGAYCRHSHVHESLSAARACAGPTAIDWLYDACSFYEPSAVELSARAAGPQHVPAVGPRFWRGLLNAFLLAVPLYVLSLLALIGIARIFGWR